MKRCFSLFLSIVMLFTMVPVQAFAVEDGHNHEDTQQTEVLETTVPETTTPGVSLSEPTEAPVQTVAEQIQGRIDAIVIQYGITEEMTDNDIANAIFAVDGDTLKATMDEIDALEQDAANLTEEEFNTLDTEQLGRFIAVLDMLYFSMIHVAV